MLDGYTKEGEEVISEEEDDVDEEYGDEDGEFIEEDDLDEETRKKIKE